MNLTDRARYATLSTAWGSSGLAVELPKGPYFDLAGTLGALWMEIRAYIVGAAKEPCSRLFEYIENSAAT